MLLDHFLRVRPVAHVQAKVIRADHERDQLEKEYLNKLSIVDCFTHLPMIFHIHIRIVSHPRHEVSRLMRRIPGHRSDFGDIEEGRLRRPSVFQRISVQIRIVLLQHVRNRQVLSPRLQSSDSPGDSLVLRRHLNDIRGHRSISSGQTVADRTDNVNVTRTKFVDGFRRSWTSSSWPIDITKEWFILAELFL